MRIHRRLPGVIRPSLVNVYACKGWPVDRPLAKKAVQKGQMAKRLAMELALYDPDNINFSESPSEAIAKEVAKHLGMNHVRFPSGGNSSRDAGDEARSNCPTVSR